MPMFGGNVMTYEYMYVEEGNVYYMNCIYKGQTYSYIKFELDSGIFSLYGENEQPCGTVSMKNFV